MVAVFCFECRCLSIGDLAFGLASFVFVCVWMFIVLECFYYCANLLLTWTCELLFDKLTIIRREMFSFISFVVVPNNCVCVCVFLIGSQLI